VAVCGRDARSGGCTENDFFGISMDYILIALVLLLGLVIASVFWVRQREAILFEIGLRNIPRRRAQSALMVLLSTVIFAAAFSTGDTVTCSITQDTFQKLGRVDIIVQAGSNPRTIALEDEQIALVGRVERPRR
jgi:putative ABC transport system permease protein